MALRLRRLALDKGMLVWNIASGIPGDGEGVSFAVSFDDVIRNKSLLKSTDPTVREAAVDFLCAAYELIDGFLGYDAEGTNRREFHAHVHGLIKDALAEQGVEVAQRSVDALFERAVPGRPGPV